MRGSLDKKERVLGRLIDDGVVDKLEYTRPKGRATHYLAVNEDVLNSVEKGRFQV